MMQLPQYMRTDSDIFMVLPVVRSTAAAAAVVTTKEINSIFHKPTRAAHS